MSAVLPGGARRSPSPSSHAAEQTAPPIVSQLQQQPYGHIGGGVPSPSASAATAVGRPSSSVGAVPDVAPLRPMSAMQMANLSAASANSNDTGGGRPTSGALQQQHYNHMMYGLAPQPTPAFIQTNVMPFTYNAASTGGTATINYAAVPQQQQQQQYHPYQHATPSPQPSAMPSVQPSPIRRAPADVSMASAGVGGRGVVVSTALPVGHVTTGFAPTTAPPTQQQQQQAYAHHHVYAPTATAAAASPTFFPSAATHYTVPQQQKFVGGALVHVPAAAAAAAAGRPLSTSSPPRINPAGNRSSTLRSHSARGTKAPPAAVPPRAASPTAADNNKENAAAASVLAARQYYATSSPNKVTPQQQHQPLLQQQANAAATILPPPQSSAPLDPHQQMAAMAEQLRAQQAALAAQQQQYEAMLQQMALAQQQQQQQQQFTAAPVGTAAVPAQQTAVPAVMPPVAQPSVAEPIPITTTMSAASVGATPAQTSSTSASVAAPPPAEAKPPVESAPPAAAGSATAIATPPTLAAAAQPQPAVPQQQLSAPPPPPPPPPPPAPAPAAAPAVVNSNPIVNGVQLYIPTMLPTAPTAALPTAASAVATPPAPAAPQPIVITALPPRPEATTPLLASSTTAAAALPSAATAVSDGQYPLSLPPGGVFHQSTYAFATKAGADAAAAIGVAPAAAATDGKNTLPSEATAGAPPSQNLLVSSTKMPVVGGPFDAAAFGAAIAAAQRFDPNSGEKALADAMRLATTMPVATSGGVSNYAFQQLHPQRQQQQPPISFASYASAEALAAANAEAAEYVAAQEAALRSAVGSNRPILVDEGRASRGRGASTEGGGGGGDGAVLVVNVIVELRVLDANDEHKWWTVRCRLSETAKSVRAKVAKAAGRFVAMLYYQGRRLDPDTPLWDSGVRADSILACGCGSSLLARRLMAAAKGEGGGTALPVHNKTPMDAKLRRAGVSYAVRAAVGANSNGGDRSPARVQVGGYVRPTNTPRRANSSSAAAEKGKDAATNTPHVVGSTHQQMVGPNTANRRAHSAANAHAAAAPVTSGGSRTRARVAGAISTAAAHATPQKASAAGRRGGAGLSPSNSSKKPTTNPIVDFVTAEPVYGHDYAGDSTALSHGVPHYATRAPLTDDERRQMAKMGINADPSNSLSDPHHHQQQQQPPLHLQQVAYPPGMPQIPTSAELGFGASADGGGPIVLPDGAVSRPIPGGDPLLARYEAYLARQEALRLSVGANAATQASSSSAAVTSAAIVPSSSLTAHGSAVHRDRLQKRQQQQQAGVGGGVVSGGSLGAAVSTSVGGGATAAAAGGRWLDRGGVGGPVDQLVFLNASAEEAEEQRLAASLRPVPSQTPLSDAFAASAQQQQKAPHSSAYSSSPNRRPTTSSDGGYRGPPSALDSTSIYYAPPHGAHNATVAAPAPPSMVGSSLDATAYAQHHHDSVVHAMPSHANAAVSSSPPMRSPPRLRPSTAEGAHPLLLGQLGTVGAPSSFFDPKTGLARAVASPTADPLAQLPMAQRLELLGRLGVPPAPSATPSAGGPSAVVAAPAAVAAAFRAGTSTASVGSSVGGTAATVPPAILRPSAGGTVGSANIRGGFNSPMQQQQQQSAPTRSGSSSGASEQWASEAAAPREAAVLRAAEGLTSVLTDERRRLDEEAVMAEMAAADAIAAADGASDAALRGETGGLPQIAPVYGASLPPTHQQTTSSSGKDFSQLYQQQQQTVAAARARLAGIEAERARLLEGHARVAASLNSSSSLAAANRSRSSPHRSASAVGLAMNSSGAGEGSRPTSARRRITFADEADLSTTLSVPTYEAAHVGAPSGMSPLGAASPPQLLLTAANPHHQQQQQHYYQQQQMQMPVNYFADPYAVARHNNSLELERQQQQQQRLGGYLPLHQHQQQQQPPVFLRDPQAIVEGRGQLSTPSVPLERGMFDPRHHEAWAQREAAARAGLHGASSASVAASRPL